jgi:hypothetical protein
MKPKNSRFAGMKGGSPYANSPKNAIRDKVNGKKRKQKAKTGSVSSSRGLSPYQLRTQEEFLKVRPGETKEKWLLRTRFRRIRTEDELALTVNGRKLIEKLEVRRNRRHKRKIQLHIIEKDFNFMKYYVFVINWAVIKYNISQMDLEIGFHFYENIHFTKDQFINKCLLIGNPKANVFNRFIKEGFIYQTQSIINDDNVKKPTGLFRLSVRFINVLTSIYDKIAYQSKFDFRSTLNRKVPPELEKVIMEMAAENTAIITGKKEPDRFVIIKQ